MEQTHRHHVAISGSDIIVLDDNSPVPHLIGKGLAPSTDWNSSYKAFPGTPFDTGSSVVASILGDRMLFNSGNTLYSGNPTQGFVKVLGVNPQDSDTIIDKGFAVAVSSNGTVYVSDNGANRVFAKAPLGGLHVVAGKADVRFAPPDMKALDFTNPLDAPLPDLGGVAIDPKTDEAVIAVQSGEPSIRRLTKGGSLKVDYKQLKAMVSTSSGEKVEVDVSPRELAFSDSGKLFIAGSSISKTGLGSSVVVGQLHPDGHIDQTIGANTLRACISICVDSRERLYFMDPIVETVYRVDADALVPLWDIDTNFKAEFGNYQPAAVCVGLNGEFYITEGFHVYRFEQSSRKKILIAGSGAPYFSGTSRDERFNIVTRMLMTKSGDLYLLDRDQVKLITASQLSQFN